MTTNSAIENQIEHDTARCDCDMCVFARNSAQKRVKTRSEVVGPENQPAGFFAPEPENAPDRQQTQNRGIPAPTFTHEWQSAPAHLKPVFHPSLIRAAVFDVMDGGCNCATSASAHHPWKFDDEIEDFANEQRVRFADAVVARLLEIRRISGERDPSSEYFYLRGERAGRIAQMLEENRVFRAMAERRGLKP